MVAAVADLLLATSAFNIFGVSSVHHHHCLYICWINIVSSATKRRAVGLRASLLLSQQYLHFDVAQASYLVQVSHPQEYQCYHQDEYVLIIDVNYRSAFFFKNAIQHPSFTQAGTSITQLYLFPQFQPALHRVLNAITRFLCQKLRLSRQQLIQGDPGTRISTTALPFSIAIYSTFSASSTRAVCCS